MNKTIAMVSVLFLLIFGASCYYIGRSDGKDIMLSEIQKETEKKLEENRIEYERRINDKDAIAESAKKERDNAASDAIASRNLANELRKRIASLNTMSNHSNTIPGSTTAEQTRILCSDMFIRINDRATELAGYADRARIAGQACEKQYDSLDF